MRVDTIDERLALFRTMMRDHAGIKPFDDPRTPDDDTLRAAAQRCLGCRDGEACRDWLAAHPEGAEPPDFCRNAGHFRAWNGDPVT